MSKKPFLKLFFSSEFKALLIGIVILIIFLLLISVTDYSSNINDFSGFVYRSMKIRNSRFFH